MSLYRKCIVETYFDLDPSTVFFFIIHLKRNIYWQLCLVFLPSTGILYYLVELFGERILFKLKLTESVPLQFLDCMYPFFP